MAIAERPAVKKRRPIPQIPTRRVLDLKGGWTSWVTTTDHKKIGVMYMVAAFVFFLVGGVEALLMRIQLGVPDNTFLTPERYNEIMTMHGTTMVFLFVVPMMAGFANYIVPLQIGARDMAFPRLNALSLWLFLVRGDGLLRLAAVLPARGRLDELHAALELGLPAQRRHRRVDLPDPPHRHRLDAGRDQLLRDDHQHARAAAWAGAACRCSAGRSSPSR